MKFKRLACASFTAALVAGFASVSLAANYPLEITNLGTAARLSPYHRHLRAYPGLEYNIRVAVVGGAYPYTFSLSNAPSGMTVDASKGTVVWPNPQGGTVTPTVTVTDSEGSRIAATWSIIVGTSGFRFVDSARWSAAPAGTGTLSNPWRSMNDVYYNSAASDIVYFRNGTYNILSLPRAGIGDMWEQVQWPAARSLIWVAYPGESPVLDFGYRAGVENGPLLRIRSDATAPYIDGFETRNTRIIGFQAAGAATFRRLRMHDLVLGGDGTNAAFIMTLTQVAPSANTVIQDCEFYNVAAEAVTIKIYAQEKLLIEDTVHHNATVGIELKDDVRRYTVRGNQFYDISATALGGNMHETTTNGEICFNNGSSTLHALDVNQDSMAGTTYVYRNTFRGRVRVRNVDSADGPFYFSENVIVNNDNGTPSGSHVYHENVSSAGRVVLSNNLVGYPNQGIVDSAGNLTAAYAGYVGTRGHQTTASVPPRAPSNVVIIR